MRRRLARPDRRFESRIGRRRLLFALCQVFPVLLAFVSGPRRAAAGLCLSRFS